MSSALPNSPLSELLESKKVDGNPIRSLFNLMYSEDCIKDPDCEEILCGGCSGILETVFGTLPLLVKCVDCEKEYILRDLVMEL